KRLTNRMENARVAVPFAAHGPAERFRTYAVGVLVGVRGPQAPEKLLFRPGVAASRHTWAEKRVLWRAKPSKPPNCVTPKIIPLDKALGNLTVGWFGHRLRPAPKPHLFQPTLEQELYR